MKYIAYGSNMEQDFVALRCPTAELLGTGWLSNMSLEFYVHATVTPKEGSSVPVAVWEIGAQDERSLDWYEGYPEYYRKEQHTVTMNDGTEISGMVYIMNEDMYRHRPPDNGYFNGIKEAYERLGLHDSIGPVLWEALRRSHTR